MARDITLATSAGSPVSGDSTLMIGVGGFAIGYASQVIGSSGSMAGDLHRNWCLRVQ